MPAFPIYLNISPDQLASAASFIAREWGDYGYRIEGIESPTHAVSLFHVACSDGSRFIVAADRYGNCHDIQPGSDAVAMVREMHANAVAA
jgi:hypothetical protein